jgi:hypothetical protein
MPHSFSLMKGLVEKPPRRCHLRSSNPGPDPDAVATGRAKRQINLDGETAGDLREITERYGSSRSGPGARATRTNSFSVSLRVFYSRALFPRDQVLSRLASVFQACERTKPGEFGTKRLGVSKGQVRKSTLEAKRSEFSTRLRNLFVELSNLASNAAEMSK